MTDSQHKDIRFLLDRIEIQDVIARYSLGQDSHQGDDGNILGEWDRTFTPDAQVDYSAAGGIVGSYRDLARWMRGDASGTGSMSAFSNWQHMLGLPNVSLAADKAFARTDFYATHRSREGDTPPVHFNAAGAFVDELVRADDGWRIQHRRLVLHFADPLQIVVPV
jgi:CubicO group peptidase (beta-lactamase class C family)